jgi:hypothetical protein
LVLSALCLVLRTLDLVLSLANNKALIKAQSTKH